jgi:hypothetical protein
MGVCWKNKQTNKYINNQLSDTGFAGYFKKEKNGRLPNMLIRNQFKNS